MLYPASIEIRRVFGPDAIECIEQQRAKGSPKPVMCGNIEARFAAPDYGSRQPFLHQLLENELLLFSLDFEFRRQRRREFHNAVIKKRRTHLNGVRHAHPIDLAENIVGKKILLIEPQIWTNPIRPRT